MSEIETPKLTQRTLSFVPTCKNFWLKFGLSGSVWIRYTSMSAKCSSVEEVMIIKEAGAQACIDGNWKNNKYTGRCVDIPDDPAAIPGSTGKVQGEYVNLPGGAWKGSGTCIYTFDGGDELHESWEEGSHLKAYKYTYTGGKGKYAKAKGGGTYTYTEQADLQGGRYNGTLELP